MDDFDLGFDIDAPPKPRNFPDDGVTDSQLARVTGNKGQLQLSTSGEPVRVPEKVNEGSQECQRVDTYAVYGVFNTSSTTNPAELEDSRFADVSVEDIEEYAAGNVNDKTKSVTEWACRVYSRWRETYMHDRVGMYVPKLEEMNRENVKKWVPVFLLAARNKNGGAYPRGTLHGLACAIKRKLVEYKIPDINFFNTADLELKPIRDVLDRRMKEVTASGVGVHRKKAKAITSADEQQLWDRGVLGMEDSTNLQNTVFFYVTKIFALRGGQELRDLKVADFEFEKLPSGKAVRFKGGKCKNFHGGLNQLKQEPKSIQHISPDGSDPCIVTILETYMDAIGHQDPFFRKHLKPLGDERYRYSRATVGHNQLSKKMAEICALGGLDGYFTNHSARRSVATQMFNKGLDEQLIMERTGHRSTDGVRQYKVTQDETVAQVSTIIGPPQKVKKPTPRKDGEGSSGLADGVALPGDWYPTKKDKGLYTARQLDYSVVVPPDAKGLEGQNAIQGVRSDDAGVVTPGLGPGSIEGMMKSVISAEFMKDVTVNVHFHSGDKK